MKKTAVLITVLFCTAFVSSCRITDDPFLTDDETSTVTTMIGTSNASETDNNSDSETNTVFVQTEPKKDFYSLTSDEAYQKYGLFTPDNSVLLNCDGRHIYVEGVIYQTTRIINDDGDIEKIVKTALCRNDYPEGGNEIPVCMDPLCEHLSGSSCPIADLKSMFSIACYADKLFYISKSQDLRVYDQSANSNKILLKDLMAPYFHRYNGKLYLIANEETSEFQTVNTIYHIYENAELSKIGSVETKENEKLLVHSDNSIVGFCVEKNDGIPCTKAVLYDLKTSDESVVFERLLNETVECENVKCDINPMSVFGDKVLFSVMYSYNSADTNTKRSDIWLVDVLTKEKQLLLTLDNQNESRNCQFSEKYILIVEPRKTVTDHFIIHLLDPYTNKETVYNLSDMASSIGERIPLDCYLNSFNLFSPVLSKMYYIPKTGVNSEGIEYQTYDIKLYKTFAFDLESGRVFKYDVPSEDDLSK